MSFRKWQKLMAARTRKAAPDVRSRTPLASVLEEVSTQTSTLASGVRERTSGAAFRVLAAISFCHFLNDMLQSVVPAVYPILKNTYHLDFGQIGLITLTSQMTASILQPVVGLYTDHRPTPYSLPVGMGFTLVGMFLLAMAPTFPMILVA